MKKSVNKLQAARDLWLSDTVNGLVDKMSVKLIGRPWADPPTLQQVRTYLADLWPGAERHAGEFHRTMELQRWQQRDRRDGRRLPIRDWRALARAFASTIERRQR